MSTSINPVEVALRIQAALHQKQSLNVSATEVVVMSGAIDDVFKLLTGLATKTRINKGDLNPLFDVLSSTFLIEG